MTDKELRKLSRRELLELLLEQTRRADELQSLLDEANLKLNSRSIELDNVGSIAEAALKLNGVFEAAEAAAQQYVASVKKASSDPASDEGGDNKVSEETAYSNSETENKKEEKKEENKTEIRNSDFSAKRPAKKKNRPMSYDELMKKLSDSMSE